MPSGILIIDDDPMVRQFVDLALVQRGYSATSEATGELGLRALQTNRWDLVLLDIDMPDMTGLEVLRLIRRSHRVKVMMMTAKGDAATVREALANGADGYIVKPFSARDLLKRVDAMLQPAKPRLPADAPDRGGSTSKA